MKTVCPRFGIICLYIICALSLLVSCGSLEEQSGGSITLEASPTSIPADGYSSSTITATVYDSSGNPVHNGTTVTFTTDLGSFSGSTSISVSTSDDTGVVTVSLIAGTTPGTATITVEANDISQLIKVSITDSGGGTASITLEAEPGCIAPDGFSSSTITATLYDSSGSPVSAGTYVTFTTNFGSFAGGTTAYGWTSDDTGVVTVSLIAGTTSGRATITAESNNVTQAVIVTFSANCEETEETEE